MMSSVVAGLKTKTSSGSAIRLPAMASSALRAAAQGNSGNRMAGIECLR